MSGFLSRLAERALGAGVAVRPLLPRRFAPLPPGPDPDRAFWERAFRERVRAEQAKRAEENRAEEPVSTDAATSAMDHGEARR